MSQNSPFFAVSDPAATVLIDLSARGVAKAFGLRANAGDTITIGSDSRADLPVAGVGMAPLQFHLERRAGVVWLRPADGVGEMLLNGARITGPVRLQHWCVIEFGDVRIEARILDAGKCSGNETERFAPYIASSASQHTERMASHRSPTGAQLPCTEAKQEISSTFTANGTETMAPIRSTSLTGQGSRRHSEVVDCPVDATVESPITRAPGSVEPPRPNSRHSALATKHSPLAQRWMSTYGSPRTFVERALPTARPASLLERIGPGAKARPLLAASGVGIGAFVLTWILLLATRPAVIPDGDLPNGPKVTDELPLAPQRTMVTAAHAPVETIESTTKAPVVGAQTATEPFRAATNDTDLADAVSAVIAGRYDDARASYSALSRRIDSPPTYSTIARLLARMADPECSDGARAAPSRCPQIHR